MGMPVDPYGPSNSVEKQAPKRLEKVRTEKEVLSNLEFFNVHARGHLERATPLLRQTKYWVYDPASGKFAPSKFAGFRCMDFELYRAGVGQNTVGAEFNGSITRAAISTALSKPYVQDNVLASQLEEWAENLCGSHTMAGVNHSKWRFVRLSQGNTGIK